MNCGSHLNAFDYLVGAVLPNRGRLMVMSYNAYFDESGNIEAKVFCVAGYFLESSQAQLMNRAWIKVLREHQIPYFHMVDCAHGVGVFEGKGKGERSDIARKLIQLIKDYTLQGFSVITHADFFKPLAGKYPDAYSAGAAMCVQGLKSLLKTRRIEGRIAYVFESGHSMQGCAYNQIAKQLSDTLGASVSFAGKTDAPLLHAADLLAWQCAKYVKDREGNVRPPRADLMSLFEHRHTLLYLDSSDPERPLMTFEEFPFEERSEITSILEAGTIGPLVYFNEGSQERPIIPVSAATGWALGGGRLAHTIFRDTKDTEFVLAFDEPRLKEAMRLLMNATSLYAESGNAEITGATRIIAREHEGRVVIGFELSSGARVYFHTDKESARALCAQLASLS